MTERLFRNRRYQNYFQLLDAFDKERCSFCYLLSQKERETITTWLKLYNPRKRRGIWLKALCVLHRSRIKEALADDLSFFTVLKKAVTASLRELAHPPKAAAPAWKRLLHAPLVRCPLCRPLLSEERNLCGALIQFLDDTEFWKVFQRAPLLCLEHLEKCLLIGGKGKAFERLLNDQSAKLTHLLNELVRFEATGTHEECKPTALNWLADFAGTSASGRALVEFAEHESSTDLPSDQKPDVPLCDDHDPEELLFENEKLRRKVRDLIQRLNEVETRAASLHYRCAELNETNKRLEMGYTGASTQARSLEKLVRDLREEIQKLKEDGLEHRARAIP
jgi:hypothetical protein